MRPSILSPPSAWPRSPPPPRRTRPTSERRRRFFWGISARNSALFPCGCCENSWPTPASGSVASPWSHPDCLVAEDPDQRIARFTHWALDLSERAGREARSAPRPGAGGNLGPGGQHLHRLPLPRTLQLSIRTAEPTPADPGLRPGGRRLLGCAVPNFQAAQEFLLAKGEGAALCVSVEICSATFHMEDDLSLLLSNALFGDGAAARGPLDPAPGAGTGGLQQLPCPGRPRGHPLHP